MSLFHSILSQLQDKISKETNATEVIAVIVSTTLHTVVSKEEVIIQGTTVRIKGSPTLKMAIMLNQKKLLTAFQDAKLSITAIA